MKRRVRQKSLYNLHRFSVDVTYDIVTKHINIISVIHKKLVDIRKKKEDDRAYYLKNTEQCKQRSSEQRKINREIASEKRKHWRKNNPEKERAYYLKTIAGKKDFVDKIKENGCAICGYDRCGSALDFHHVNPQDKKFNIARYTKVNSDLVEEIEKCVLVCRNCHMEIEILSKRGR